MIFTSQNAFFALVALLIVQRILEVLLSKRNERQIIAAGGREHAPGHFIVMKLLHATWFVAMVAEVWLGGRNFIPWLGFPALAVLFIGQGLRYAAIRTLGKRWTVKIMTLPGEPPVHNGIFRYIRHPNYLGVILEIAAVPLIHSAYLTAIAYSLANGLLLRVRISAEEKALDTDNQYRNFFGTKKN